MRYMVSMEEGIRLAEVLDRLSRAEADACPDYHRPENPDKRGAEPPPPPKP